jgi:hypothetical protein
VSRGSQPLESGQTRIIEQTECNATMLNRQSAAEAFSETRNAPMAGFIVFISFAITTNLTMRGFAQIGPAIVPMISVAMLDFAKRPSAFHDDESHDVHEKTATIDRNPQIFADAGATSKPTIRSIRPRVLRTQEASLRIVVQQ